MQSNHPHREIRWTSAGNANDWFIFTTEEGMACLLTSDTEAEFRAKLYKMGRYVTKSKVKAAGGAQ